MMYKLKRIFRSKIFWFIAVFGITLIWFLWPIGEDPKFGNPKLTTTERCVHNLGLLYVGLEIYADHNYGRLPEPPPNKRDDPYFGVQAISYYLHNYLPEALRPSLYCPSDASRRAPSSYQMNTKLYGKKLSFLKKYPRVFVLIENKPRHQVYRFAVEGDGNIVRIR